MRFRLVSDRRHVIRDIYAPAAPGSLMRSMRLTMSGLWRLARRDAELYSVQIVSAGSWARARVLNAAHDPIWPSPDMEEMLWYQPSTFTGSFWLGGAARGGLLVEISSNLPYEACNLTINWRERTPDMV